MLPVECERIQTPAEAAVFHSVLNPASQTPPRPAGTVRRDVFTDVECIASVSYVSVSNVIAVADRVKVIRDQAAWSNFFFLLIFLAALPMFSRYRVAAFEAERWKQATGTTIIELARMFEVSKGTIHDIVSCRRRAQVAEPLRLIARYTIERNQ